MGGKKSKDQTTATAKQNKRKTWKKLFTENTEQYHTFLPEHYVDFTDYYFTSITWCTDILRAKLAAQVKRKNASHVRGGDSQDKSKKGKVKWNL